MNLLIVDVFVVCCIYLLVKQTIDVKIKFFFIFFITVVKDKLQKLF